MSPLVPHVTRRCRCARTRCRRGPEHGDVGRAVAVEVGDRVGVGWDRRRRQEDAVRRVPVSGQVAVGRRVGVVVVVVIAVVPLLVAAGAHLVGGHRPTFVVVVTHAVGLIRAVETARAVGRRVLHRPQVVHHLVGRRRRVPATGVHPGEHALGVGISVVVVHARSGVLAVIDVDVGDPAFDGGVEKDQVMPVGPVVALAPQRARHGGQRIVTGGRKSDVVDHQVASGVGVPTHVLAGARFRRAGVQDVVDSGHPLHEAGLILAVAVGLVAGPGVQHLHPVAVTSGADAHGRGGGRGAGLRFRRRRDGHPGVDAGRRRIGPMRAHDLGSLAGNLDVVLEDPRARAVRPSRSQIPVHQPALGLVRRNRPRPRPPRRLGVHTRPGDRYRGNDKKTKNKNQPRNDAH